MQENAIQDSMSYWNQESHWQPVISSIFVFLWPCAVSPWLTSIQLTNPFISTDYLSLTFLAHDRRRSYEMLTYMAIKSNHI